jgi:predicted ribosome quality control (RQC) complex YloA/Tae2 family protein
MRSRGPGDYEASGQFWRYELAGGWRVLAGRTEDDNDLLSTRIAKPDDWWFHVHGTSGSHVILEAREDAEPDRDTLRMAAAIAAYHSKARNAGIVPVTCTRARYVTKPRGAKPGLVYLQRETTMKVRPAVPHPGKLVRLPE